MNLTEKAFRLTWQRLVLIQLVLVGIAAVIAGLNKGSAFTIALIYGGAISVATTLVQAWRIKIATDEAARNAAIGMAEMYKGMVIKYLLVIGLMYLGLSTIELTPAAVIIGFIVAHLGFLLARPVGSAKRRVG